MSSPRCPACAMPEGWCLCDRVPHLPPTLPIDLIRHVREADKLSNSARLAALALPALRLHDYGAPGPPFQLAPLLRPDTALLYPQDPELPAREVEPQEVGHLLILDGTWSQVRRMVRRLPGASALPRLVLDAPFRAAARLRRPPVEGGMATLEALAQALGLLHGPALSLPLAALYDELCLRGQALRGKGPPPPGLGFRPRGPLPPPGPTDA